MTHPPQPDRAASDLFFFFVAFASLAAFAMSLFALFNLAMIELWLR